MTSSSPLPLCSVCARQSAGEGGQDSIRVAAEDASFECALCFGILHPSFIDEVSKAAEAHLASCPYDATSFILALNLPTSQTLREQIIKKRFPSFNGILADIPFKVRNINAYLSKLQQASGLRPTLMSDLQLTITFENGDFLDTDTEFLKKAFPQEFRIGKKRRQNGEENGNGDEPELTKNRLQNMLGRIDEKLASTFPVEKVPSRPCKFSFAFERDPVYIAGRYCKYSRALPQSPWSAEEDSPPIPGHSVSEKVTGAMVKLLGATETRFVASGREDIDVRMLGEGRPFVVHLINCRTTQTLRPERRVETLAALREAINKSSVDVSVSELALLSREVAEQLSMGQEDKKKLYTAYCYSTLPIDSAVLKAATRIEPLEIIQKTPVRVMKRRALLDRPRSIYTLETMPLDAHHFLVRMETQAGTYIKEFVHGDFGRTRPSLADLIGCEKGEVDIVELDVERVDLVWPPVDTGKKDEKRRMSVTVLMVAEKPMLADSIARLLSDGRCNKRKGMNKICSVSEYHGDFMGQPAFFKVTSTCGHVMGVDFPEEFNNWHRVAPVELYTAPIEKIECSKEMKMNRYLASEAKGVDYLVLWLDCDKEGENICFEVIDAVQGKMKKPRNVDFMSLVYRAHFSAITEFDIKAAMRNLGRPDQNVSLSVDARRELDLRVGCSFTRFQTKFFKGKYAELDASTVSYGPCQTPTLAFCVNRHDEIINFRPEPYWVIQTVFEARDGSAVKGDWARGRVHDPAEAHMYLERIRQVGGATVNDINTKRSERERPPALNTVKLMRAASTQLGLAPATTMHVAESLYTQGYISYPRTETSTYPSNFDLRGTLQRQTNDRRWGDIASRVLQEGINRPRGGVDKGDHPPITPMRSDGGVLHGDNARVYEYVVRHFIATLMKNCVYEVTTVKMRCGEEEFSFQGKQLIDPGFTVILNASGAEKDVWLPRVERGDHLRLRSAEVVDRQTMPPSYLTESELISMMEHHGIGTDASIPVHINTICQRNYVKVEAASRRLIPTQLGVCLIHGYHAVDPELVLPTIRADLERQLDMIASGQADFMTVKSHAVDLFRRKFIYFNQNMPTFDALFAATFTTVSLEERQSTVCGKCRVNSKTPGHLHCQSCNDANKRGANIRSAGVVTRGSRGGRGRGTSSRGAPALRATRGTGVRGVARGTRGTRGRGSASARGTSDGGGNANTLPLGPRGGGATRSRGRGSVRGAHPPLPPPPLPMPPPIRPPVQQSQQHYIPPPPTHFLPPPPPLPLPPSHPPPPSQPSHHHHYNHHQQHPGPSRSFAPPPPRVAPPPMRHAAPWPTEASPPKRVKQEPPVTPTWQPTDAPHSRLPPRPGQNGAMKREQPDFTADVAPARPKPAAAGWNPNDEFK